ncbi:hypothetical protein [Shimia biformata]|uniref:hypothetical protein n=1 Tax=Shimia biformata TaxID=1294299 RepID=UPI001950DB4B|nr:hypothetical protein [Shimia biformata]
MNLDQRGSEHARAEPMHTLEHGYRAIWLLFDVNWDRLLFPGAIVAALLLATYMRSLGWL